MSDPDYDLLNSQSRALLSNEADEIDLSNNYLTRETYSRERVSTLMTSF